MNQSYFLGTDAMQLYMVVTVIFSMAMVVFLGQAQGFIMNHKMHYVHRPSKGRLHGKIAFILLQYMIKTYHLVWQFSYLYVFCLISVKHFIGDFNTN